MVIERSVATRGSDGSGEQTVPLATVTIGGQEHRASGSNPVVFGRADGPGVVGLDPRDMGISGVAGSIEWKGLWFVVNRSRKRKLYIDDSVGGGPQPLDCGQGHAINVTSLRVRVRGEIYTHIIDVVVPATDLPHFRPEDSSTGTIVADVCLTKRDRAVVVALFEGYLLPFPHAQPWPRTYKEAAQRLKPPWTDVRVRKQIERLRERLSRSGPALQGPRALYELADYLISNNVISGDDLPPGPP